MDEMVLEYLKSWRMILDVMIEGGLDGSRQGEGKAMKVEEMTMAMDCCLR